MGNCMERCVNRKQAKEKHEEIKQEDIEKRENLGENNIVSSVVVKETCLLRSEKRGLRIKIVVTKEELEWLMVQLNNNNKGGKSLEAFLGEIEKGREKVNHSWKPSLESIMECPEVVQEMDR